MPATVVGRGRMRRKAELQKIPLGQNRANDECGAQGAVGQPRSRKGDAWIDQTLYLAGRNDQPIGERKSLNELFTGLTDDLPVILLDHRPTQLQEASRTITDVQFSGHTHNGQLFPINLITRQIYELAWGYKKINSTHFFVSSGLRLWGPPVKTAGKAEVMLVYVLYK